MLCFLFKRVLNFLHAFRVNVGLGSLVMEREPRIRGLQRHSLSSTLTRSSQKRVTHWCMHFEPYGKVRIRRNFTFVQFATQEDATKALESTPKQVTRVQLLMEVTTNTWLVTVNFLDHRLNFIGSLVFWIFMCFFFNSRSLLFREEGVEDVVPQCVS